MQVAIASIKPSRLLGDVRGPPDPAMLQTLATSIKTVGLMHPVMLRPVDGGYETIAGHRRIAAARLIGWDTIEATILKEVDDKTAAILTIRENLDRADWDDYTRGLAFYRVTHDIGMSIRDLASAIQQSPSYIVRHVQMAKMALSIPPDLTEYYASKLNERQARELLKAPPEALPNLIRETVEGKLTVEQVAQRVDQISQAQERSSPRPNPDESHQETLETFGFYACPKCHSRVKVLHTEAGHQIAPA